MNDTEILNILNNINSNGSLTITTILSVVFLGVLLATKFWQLKELSSCNKKNIQVNHLEKLTEKLIENTNALNELNNVLVTDEIKLKVD